jgi:hypothetical protein
MKRPPTWLTIVLLTVAVLAMLTSVIFIPLRLHPTLSDAEFSGVADDRRVELQQAQAKLQNDARSTLLQGFGGLLLVVGALSTWRQVQISRHGQITDRITRAVEQLASGDVNVRLGGLYALERVARNSYEDRTTITSILTAFVRTHAPWPTNAKDRPTIRSILSVFARMHAPSPASASDGHQHPRPAVDDSLPELGARAVDVQLALFILAYRPRSGDERPPYLSFTDLRKAGMGHDGWWSNLICKQSNLAGARFREARLDRAVLNGSDLRQANLVAARLLDAELVGAPSPRREPS